MKRIDQNTPVLKVSVFSDGRLLVNDVPTSVGSLRECFRELSKQGGFVWYYRENPERPAPQLAKQVIAEIISARLSVRLSTKPDYSDAFVPNVPPKQPKVN